MSQSSSFANLIVVSRLSCHSFVCVVALDEDCDGVVDKRDMLVNMLRGASVALTPTFTVATTLALDIDPFKSNKISQDSPKLLPRTE